MEKKDLSVYFGNYFTRDWMDLKDINKFSRVFMQRNHENFS